MKHSPEYLETRRELVKHELVRALKLPSRISADVGSIPLMITCLEAAKARPDCEVMRGCLDSHLATFHQFMACVPNAVECCIEQKGSMGVCVQQCSVAEVYRFACLLAAGAAELGDPFVSLVASIVSGLRTLIDARGLPNMAEQLAETLDPAYYVPMEG